MAKYTINKDYYYEYEIKKSKFIVSLFPVNSIDECLNKLKEVRKKYYDATHNCYSYIINENMSYTIKNSDDGEPSKTAGIVIYDVLNKNDLENVLCIVTRYFGGIKLGAGGLVRAYAKGASDVVASATKIKIESKASLSFSIPYNYVDDVLNKLKDYTLDKKEFLEDANLTYTLPEEKIDEVKEILITATKNTIRFK